jgi:hypothetical protein
LNDPLWRSWYIPLWKNPIAWVVSRIWTIIRRSLTP